MIEERDIAAYKKDLVGMGYEESTYGDEILGALDHGADVISGIVGPLLNTGQTIVDRVTGASLEESQRAAALREKQFDYIPRTKIGQAYSDTGKQVLEETLGPAVKSVVDYTEPAWSQIPEHDRMALSAATELGAIGFGSAASSAVKAGTKSAVKAVAPTLGKAADKVDQLIVKAGLLDADEIPTSSTAEQLRTDKGYYDVPPPTVDEIGFTSGIEEAIIDMQDKGILGDSIDASQLLGKLGGRNPYRGVRLDELEWSTFSDWLESKGSQQVTPAEALQEAKDRSITLTVTETNPEISMFKTYVPKGGDNYREYLFRFDTGIEELKEPFKILQQETRDLKEQYELVTIAYSDAKRARVNELTDEWDANNPQPDVQDDEWMENPHSPISDTDSPSTRHYKLQKAYREVALKQVKEEYPRLKEHDDLSAAHFESYKAEAAMMKQINDGTFDSIHWKSGRTSTEHNRTGKLEGQDNAVFHARVTDREIAGGKSLALDEIQSDWHQGQGDVPNRPYYKMPPKKLHAHIKTQIKQAGKTHKTADKAYNAKDAEVRKISKEFDDIEFGDAEDKLLDDRRDLYKAKEKAEEELNNHKAQLEILDTEGYGYFTKGLRADAPLKNKDKWLAAALNAMLYKAVKEGYDSVSWPNGKSQSTLYPQLGPEKVAALEEMYDVTVPAALKKLSKNLDGEAKIVEGKKSVDSNPTPRNADRGLTTSDQAAMEADFDMHEQAFGGMPDYDMTFERFSRDWVRRDEFGNRIENGTRTEDWQLEEDHEIYLQDFVETPDDVPYTLEEYKAKFGFQEYDAINSAYSHIKITPTMKAAILKGAPLFNKGGLVEGEMGRLGFADGGLPERTVPMGGSTNPSDSLGDVEFRAGLEDQLSWNPLARLGYDPKKGKVVKPTSEGSRVAVTLTKDNDTDNIKELFRDQNFREEDASRMGADTVVLTPNVADDPIWSHEYTHRGLNILRDSVEENSDAFVAEYGQDAYDLLVNRDRSEYITELLDDMESETYGVVDMDGKGVQTTKAQYYRKDVQDILRDRSPTGGAYAMSKPAREIIRAAGDMLEAQGEPEQAEYSEPSMWDEMKSLFN